MRAPGGVGDGTGLVDLAFFDDSHDACAHTVFDSWLLHGPSTARKLWHQSPGSAG
ncbi:hypothetical protein [Streptomyces aurantiogriseus]|uniref:hypothetical protein n=1 Tax=Streptomyces aurantiogriseus TaxID=66870 RepID=UPI001675AA3D|nr:hypothetical protein [Streptomyces aurantiogriseus]